jgi:hypothetical protein
VTLGENNTKDVTIMDGTSRTTSKVDREAVCLLHNLSEINYGNLSARKATYDGFNPELSSSKTVPFASCHSKDIGARMAIASVVISTI